jgi:flagellar hook assembly protein FlgD
MVAGATAHAFSPDGDRWQDTVALRISSREPVAARVSVRTPAGKTVWSGGAPIGEAPSVTWRGRDRSGRSMEDGVYRVMAVVTDAAGNRSTLTGKVRIDRTAGHLRPAPSLFFPQDGDALARTTRVTFKLRGRATTTLRVIDARGTVVRTAWRGHSRGAGTTGWMWDGRAAGGALLPRGRYRLELVATAGGVTQIIRRGVVMDAFAITPSTSTPARGTRLTVEIASAEPLKGAPRVSLSQAGTTVRSVTARRQSEGRYRAVFTLAAGATGTATLTVTAVDARGRTNTTTLNLAVR